MRMEPALSARFASALAAASVLASCAHDQSLAPAPAPGPTPVQQGLASYAEWAAACDDWDEWDKPGPPYRIHGDTYYVGTCGISAILVTGDKGHVLLDTGTEAGTEHVIANIRSLGFRPEDVALLLISHEHHDHAAGTARMQKLSGARLVATGPAADVLSTGQPGKRDPQFAAGVPMPPARVDETIGAVEFVKQGALSFMQMPTPGHTPGASSWQWISCEDDECLSIVYADSLSPVSADGYRFSDDRELLDDYRRGLDYLADSDCDLLLTPHPSASRMRERLERGELAGQGQCRDYAISIRKRLDARIAEETAP